MQKDLVKLRCGYNATVGPGSVAETRRLGQVTGRVGPPNCGSIMVARLQKIDPIVADAIDQAVFLTDAPGPASSHFVPQQFRLSNSLKRIAPGRCDQVHHSEGPSRDLSLPGIGGLPEILDGKKA